MARLIDADAITKNTIVDFVGENGGFISHGDVLWLISNRPTIEPKQEWISVKDRLPEVEERVLVYSYEDGINFGYFLGYEDGFFIDCVYPNEPTHWMPLPEPPERDGE